jgi:sensor histidine kinase regulating citrate/malate metabolism
VVPAAVGLMFSSLLIFGLLKMTAKQGSIITENALIRQQLRVVEENNAALLENYEAQDRLMHGLKDHMDSIQKMLLDGDYEGASSYIRMLKKETYISIYKFRSNNSTVDAILHVKDKLAEGKGVKITATLGELSTLRLDPAHLVTVLTNTIDNAIEACERVPQEDRHIELKILIEDGILVYSVINPVIERVEINENMIATTKKGELTFGLGLQKVASSLRELNGEYEIGCDGHKFQFTALIRLDEKM